MPSRRGKGVLPPVARQGPQGGFLYIDEVNLLNDHIVDVILDAAGMGDQVSLSGREFLCASF